MRTVLIVLFDGVQSLDVTGPLEVFAGANRWQYGRDQDGPDTTNSTNSTNGPDGPAYRIVGRRRLGRLLELIGEAPAGVPSEAWPHVQ